MLGESALKTSNRFKPILAARRKRNHEDRQKASLSILSLLPQNMDSSTNQQQTLQNRIITKKRSSGMLDTVSGYFTNNSSFITANLYKKSSQKQRKIFNKLKINNQSCIRKISHIIFKAEIQQIINRIQRKALTQISQGKNMASTQHSSFRLSDACRVSHMKLGNQSRYAKWEKLCTSITYRSNSTTVQRASIKTKSLKTTLQTKLKNYKPNGFKKDQLRGWQSTPKRYLTHYEQLEDFDHLY